jgi:hypothetical protein
MTLLPRQILKALTLGLAVLPFCAATAQDAAPSCQTGKILVVPFNGPESVVQEFVTQRNVPARAKTTATIRWNDTHLIVRFDCADTNVVARERPRGDVEMWKDDCVEIFLDIGHTHKPTGPRWHLLVSASGGILEETENMPGYDGRNLAVNTHLTSDGWSAEILIPWTALSTRPQVGDVWGFNLNREEHPSAEYLCWSPTWGDFNSFRQWGHIVFAGSQTNDNKETCMKATSIIAATHAEVFARYAARIAQVEREEGLGCEANPTGDPIGGGPGYRATFSQGDFTVRTAEEFLAALKQARPNQIVFIPGDVTIDLAGHENIDLPAGIIVASSRGLTNSAGGKIVMKSQQTGSFYLFQTVGDKVRLTGLTFEGPDGDNDQHNGYVNLLRTIHHGLEVDNCEIQNWGYGAVVGQLGASGIYVHHCHIHHCQGAAHDGYGVSLDACDARVIANKFSDIRNHAVSGTGRPGTSYEAAFNWVDGNFDMHGGRDRGDGTEIGGDWMDIHHNSFQQTHAVNCISRGIPSQGAKLHHNRFKTPLKISAGGTAESLAERNINAYRNLNTADMILEE